VLKKACLNYYRQLSGSELVYSGKEETQKDYMPLSIKAIASHATLFQVDNTYESSKDVTRRGAIVDLLINSATSKVKPISVFSKNYFHTKINQHGSHLVITTRVDDCL
jgi:hypothetical protein